MTRVRITAWLGRQLTDNARKAVADALNETAFACETEAKLRAPVDTGFLRSTISVTKQAEARGNQVSAEFGNVVADYALWQELGTSRMAAHPFLRPAADVEVPKFPARLASRLGQ